MRLKILVLLAASVFLAACDTPAPGAQNQRIYWISKSDTSNVQFRMLDGVNALRAAVNAPPVAFSAALNASAATHARDVSLQNRAWHFGSDGTSPIDRAVRAGYPGPFLGETISETYETEMETLAAWMERPDSREVILDARAKFIGFSWYQEKSGKIWWVLNLGG